LPVNFNKITELRNRLNGLSFSRYIIAEACRRFFLPDSKVYYSQGGEDVHILTLLDDKSNGFYIDIGCNDPIHYSNTFKMYTLGWMGILVDGNPKLIEKAKKVRKKDICINALVSNDVREMDFYLSGSNLISSVDPAHAASYTNLEGKTQKVRMSSVTIDQIIAQYVPEGKTIDLLSIDVEGHDFEVLQSITLSKYRPRLIVIEDLGQVKNNLDSNTYVKYLKSYNYVLVSTDKQNLYFMPDENISGKA
jgi:FkbM family methyltransferase